MSPGLTLTGRLDGTGAKLARADVRAWLGRAACWFETAGDTVLAARVGPGDDGRPVLRVAFHPAADDAEVRLTTAGTVRLSAATAPAGPGYHLYLAAAADAFAEDFGVVWDKADDPTGFLATGDRAALDRQFLACLWRACGDAAGGPGPAAVGLPADHGFTHPGPVLTPTGPRSRDWLAAVAADPAAGADFFPWWDPDPDARFYRGRALTRLWCEFPWRPPLTDAEGELTDGIAADLDAAFALDPGADLPWREWAEVLAAVEADKGRFTAGLLDPKLKQEVLRRAAAVDPGAPPVGYRRHPVRVPVGGGWSVEVPGAFADEWADDGLTWHGWDPTRRVTARVGGLDPCPRVGGDAGPAGWRVAGTMVAGGETLCYRVEGADPADRAWADAVGRSVRHRPAGATTSVA